MGVLQRFDLSVTSDSPIDILSETCSYMGMRINEKNGLSFFQFSNLGSAAGLWHGIFTRHGGYSQVPFQSLNVSLSVGDSSDNVTRNRSLILACSEGSGLIFTEQRHGVKVIVLKKNMWIKDQFDLKPTPQGDALVTDVRHQSLVVKVADCQSILLYDPEKHVAANIHSGWRGSIHNIIGKTIRTMKAVFGCDPNHIQAGVGPSLGPCCAEFVNYRKEIPKRLWDYKVAAVHFDFWALSRDQLYNGGVQTGNMCFSNICTKCNTDQFFSYRGEGVTGRFAAVITLK